MATPATAARARLVQLLAPAVEGVGADLEDVAVSPAGKRRVVRVVVDRDGGIDLDDVAQVSRVVSDLLDEAELAEPDLLGGAYVLEVSSPGVDRPLTEPRHWRRAVARMVTAHLGSGEAVTGRIVSAAGPEVVLDVDGTQRAVLLAEVVRAAVQVEFHRPGPVDEPGTDDQGSDDPGTDDPGTDDVHIDDDEGDA